MPEFETEEITVVTSYETLSQVAAKWREELRSGTNIPSNAPEVREIY